MHCRALLLATFALAISSTTVTAQQLTDAEILERFLIQREAYTAARTGNGSTRGLSIVTVDDPLPAPTDDSVIVADTAPEQSSPVDGDTAPIATAPSQKATASLP